MHVVNRPFVGRPYIGLHYLRKTIPPSKGESFCTRYALLLGIDGLAGRIRWITRVRSRAHPLPPKRRAPQKLKLLEVGLNVRMHMVGEAAASDLFKTSYFD